MSLLRCSYCLINISISHLRSIWFNEREIKVFNGCEGNGKGDILVKYMFDSKERKGGQMRYFN